MNSIATAAAHYNDEERPDIALEAVESSQVKAIGYDEQTETLAVTFTRGARAIYHYPSVKRATFDAFKSSDSIGKFFGEHIKGLPFKKYRAEAAQ